MAPFLPRASPAPSRSFGLVPIPVSLRVQFAVLAVAVGAGTLAWEHMLRAAFPAPIPHAKGYQAHEGQLRQLAQKGAASKKRQ